MKQDVFFVFSESEGMVVIVFWSLSGTQCTEPLRTTGDVEEALIILQVEEALEEEHAQGVLEGIFSTSLPIGEASESLKEGDLKRYEVSSIIYAGEDLDSYVPTDQLTM